MLRMTDIRGVKGMHPLMLIRAVTVSAWRVRCRAGQRSRCLARFESGACSQHSAARQPIAGKAGLLHLSFNSFDAGALRDDSEATPE